MISYYLCAGTYANTYTYHYHILKFGKFKAWSYENLVRNSSTNAYQDSYNYDNNSHDSPNSLNFPTIWCVFKMYG